MGLLHYITFSKSHWAEICQNEPIYLGSFSHFLGTVVVGTLKESLCLQWVFQKSLPQSLQPQLEKYWPKATAQAMQTPVCNVWKTRFESLIAGKKADRFSIALCGTPFTCQVWKETAEIPYGSTTTYQAMAVRLGNSLYSRAVGTALGKNPILGYIPCHRVLPKNSNCIGNFAWGVELKSALLAEERGFLCP